MKSVFVILLFSMQIGFAQTPAFKEVAIVQSRKIGENSGIDLSFTYPDAVWTHNDSGGKPWLFLVSLKTGETLATVQLNNSLNRDWEDIATFTKDGKNFIVAADVGDNLRRRKEYQLCILEEPVVAPGDELLKIDDWIDLRFTYEDGPKNCESIGIDLENNRIILIEKIYHNVSGITGVYELPIPEKSKDNAVAKRIASLGSKNFSAMDISDDGLAMIVRAYHAGFLYRRNPGESWAETLGNKPSWFIFPMQLQGEGVCFTADGEAVLISTEKKKQPIYEVQLPEAKD